MARWSLQSFLVHKWIELDGLNTSALVKPDALRRVIADCLFTTILYSQPWAGQPRADCPAKGLLLRKQAGSSAWTCLNQRAQLVLTILRAHASLSALSELWARCIKHSGGAPLGRCLLEALSLTLDFRAPLVPGTSSEGL